jgi:hypothetical protein
MPDTIECAALSVSGDQISDGARGHGLRTVDDALAYKARLIAEHETRNYGFLPGREEDLRQEIRARYDARQREVDAMKRIVARVKYDDRTEFTEAETSEFIERRDRVRGADPIDLLDL